jgi:peptidoglycan hydrolase CwlO-like protein
LTPEECSTLVDVLEKNYSSLEVFLKEVIDAVRKGEKVRLIKAHRCITGLGLKESKDIIEAWVPNEEFSRLRETKQTEAMLRETIDRQSAELSTMRSEKWDTEEKLGRSRSEVTELEDEVHSLKEELAFFKKRAALVDHYGEVLKDLLGGSDH